MVDSKKSIAVIVVNYNSSNYLRTCIDTLTSQSEPADRIVVIDNNSDDGSADSIEDRYPQVELVREKSNIGFAAANNRAMELVEDCDWVALINPDATVNTDLIALLRASISDNPGVQMFSCRLLDAENDELLDGTGDQFHVSGIAWRRDHGVSALRSRDSSETIFAPCAAAALYKTDWVRRAGGFDEAYFCYNEDTDLAFRMRLIGADCLHLDHISVNHVGSGISGSDSDFTVYHGHRNLVWTYFKNMPAFMFWWYLPQHLLLNIASLMYYTFKGRPGIIFRAKWDAILGLPRVIRQRASIQRNRTVSNRTLRSAMVTSPLAPYLRNNA